MALVTVQRSLSACEATNVQVIGPLDEVDSYKPIAEVKKQRSVSECYFVVKGAALILPHDECMHVYSRKTSNNGGKSCDIQLHLKSMFYLLREEDTLRMAVKLESMHTGRTRYLVVVSCNGGQDSEESVLLGIDCSNKTTIGLVLPVWADTHITLDGDGGFSVSSSGRHHIFKPVSVQAMWSALQTLHKASAKAREYNYFAGGGTHQWIDNYEKCIDSDRSCLNEWHAMDDLESRRPPSPDTIRSKPTEREATEKLIRTKLKELMMSVDLDEVTSKFIRTSLEEEVDMNLNEYKSFIDQEMLMILGQMDAPTEIFEYLYLGSEWNASNLDELKANGVDHILNVTREIDNFFPGMFDYLNVRVYDDESTEMLKYWDKTFKYIKQVKSVGSKVLVHCKMGISRSASVVIAYVMKAYDWDLEKASHFVKNKRNCIKPNQGFVKQLEIYQGILDASKQRHNSLWRSKSETNLSAEDRENRLNQSNASLGIEDNNNSCFHLSLPGSISRPKSWSPDDSIVKSLFPICPLVFDKPFEPSRQRSATDPSCYLNLEAGKTAIKQMPVVSEKGIENSETLHSKSVPRVSSIKDRINELESQVGAGNSVDCQQRLQSKTDSKQQSLASSKSGLVLNLATQFESVSKPNTPSPDEELTTIEVSLQFKDGFNSDLQGVEPVLSQTKPPVSKHQAVLVKPTWNQIESEHSQTQQCNTNDHKTEESIQKPTTTEIITNVRENSDSKEDFNDRTSLLTNGPIQTVDNNQREIKKASHCRARDVFSRQNSTNASSLSSPKSVEPFLWSSRQSSSSSPSVSSPPPFTKRWTIGDAAVASSSLSSENSTPQCDSLLSPTVLDNKRGEEEISRDVKSIQNRLLMQDEFSSDFRNNAYFKREFLYEKEDIPWTPGTVRRTKQRIESNTLKRTTSFDSAFPAQSKSTPSTPPELSSSPEMDSVIAVTRSHSLHNEHRPRSMAFHLCSPKWNIGHLCEVRKKKYLKEKQQLPPIGVRRISHSVSTPSVVEAVNDVLRDGEALLRDGEALLRDRVHRLDDVFRSDDDDDVLPDVDHHSTRGVLNSAIQHLPSHLDLDSNDAIKEVELVDTLSDLSNPQPGIVKQNRDILENLTPKNTQNIVKSAIDVGDHVKNRKEQIRQMKEFGRSLVSIPDNGQEDENDLNSYGVVKRLTKELEAKAGSPPGHKKERLIIIDKEIEESVGEKSIQTPPSSPHLIARILNAKETSDSSVLLRKPRTQSDASDRNSMISDTTTTIANQFRSRKTSLDMDKLRNSTGNAGLRTHENKEAQKSKGTSKLTSPTDCFLTHSLKTSTVRPPPSSSFKFPYANIQAAAAAPPPPPPPPPPLPSTTSVEGPAKKARKLQQGKSHPLSKLTLKQRHANPLYNTM